MDHIRIKTVANNIDENKEQSSWSMKVMMLLCLQRHLNMYQRLHNTLDTCLSSDYQYENSGRILFFLIYLFVSIVLSISVIIYRVHQRLHWLEVIARICGMQLNFNCMLMIVLMLRYTTTVIRMNRRLRTLIPIDDLSSIHRIIGRWIVVLVFIHALFHMIYFAVEGHGKETSRESAIFPHKTFVFFLL